MKFVITKKSARIGNKVSEIKVVRIDGVEIRERVPVKRNVCSSENTGTR
jgi:hypothetical protein